MKILLIVDHIPFPPDKGTSIRNYNLLRRIAKAHEVWVVALTSPGESREGVSRLMEFCKGVETVEIRHSGALEHPLMALRYLILGHPIELRHYQSSEMVDRIRQLASRVDFDIIDIVNSYMGLYLEALAPELRQKTVLTFIDVVSSAYERISRLEPSLPRKFRTWLYSRMMRGWEPYYAERFARCITVSESDRRLLLSSNPRLKMDVVPNGIDTRYYQQLPYPNGKPALVFVGGLEYRPNIDAVHYFCLDVYPQIKAALPDLEVWIVGHNPPGEVRALAGDHIHVTGSVNDVRPYYELSTVSIVPLRAGGGTRLKILESMALGRPVVSTSIGCEGLDVVDGEHISVADTSEQFARKILNLLTDEELRKRMIGKARELVVNRYDWDIITQSLMQTYSEVAN